MRIAVVNGSTRASNDAVLRAIRAVNRQIESDFEPHWDLRASLRFAGTTRAGSLVGEAAIYLLDEPKPDEDYDGWHSYRGSGVPYAFVYTGVAKKLPEDWSVTLSHEALELLADPLVNSLVTGPHPRDRRRHVHHLKEVCDPVQAESYEIDGVRVSNFVLPSYFHIDGEPGARVDFLGGAKLKSFGLRAGGYLQFIDPRTGETKTVFADDEARRRAAVKNELGELRRATRHLAVEVSREMDVAPRTSSPRLKAPSTRRSMPSSSRGAHAARGGRARS